MCPFGLLCSGTMEDQRCVAQQKEGLHCSFSLLLYLHSVHGGCGLMMALPRRPGIDVSCQVLPLVLSSFAFC